MAFTFVIQGAIRTKKTSNLLVHIPGKRTEEFHICPACKQEVGRGRGFDKILPSKAFQQWMDAAVLQGPTIRYALTQAGARLPSVDPVSVKALFYRQTATGDLVGFQQALFDSIQSPMYSFPCTKCAKKTQSADHRGVKCTECGAALHQGKQSRQGIGIILDDSQIKSTDGSRLLIDRENPRVEIWIEEFLEEPLQPALFVEPVAEIMPSLPITPKPVVAPALAKPLVFPSTAPAKIWPDRGLIQPGDPDY
jgi:ssDNA-binding Zn-finger/Zn-ribbon topoisomerase 1